jgi:nitrite reductase/ring-hydroxylating ferredoxin subunit/multimeric flavodoxin WrbA
MAEGKWHDLGPVDALKEPALRQLEVAGTVIALSYRDGEFGAVSGVCNHVGGPLGEGRLEGEYVVCPWHHWKFHRRTGEGEPGFESDRVPRHQTRVADGRLLIDLEPRTKRHKEPHAPHPLARPPRREPGPVRVAGLSTTVMDPAHPRYSGSDDLLQWALGHAAGALAAETRLIRLNELAFRSCEGYYSKSARACTWPCSITQMDAADQMERVYEALVHWADVVLLATPIRWGAASSLYYKMVERLNCVQNQITTHDRVLIRNKVAAFIIVGGQDNVQAVAGQLLGFFAEIGFTFPQFPFVAHSRGWTAEDMERNVAVLQTSRELRQGVEALTARSVEAARVLLRAEQQAPARVSRGGRKAHRLVSAGEA